MDKHRVIMDTLMKLFVWPLFFMWCWEYLHDDFNLPPLGYWKCFWLLFAVGCFQPLVVTTRDFYKVYEKK